MSDYFKKAKHFAQEITSAAMYHEYSCQTALGPASVNSLDRVFQVMLSSTRYIAPTDENFPVSGGMTVHVNVLGTKNNPISVAVIPKLFTVVNTTKQGHILHPGSVTRRLVNLGGTIFINTFGTGSGVVQGSFNLIPGDALFGLVLPRKYTPSGAINNEAASVVWGNVDKLLKAALTSSGGGGGY